jgi:hypothetical protein
MQLTFQERADIFKQKMMELEREYGCTIASNFESKNYGAMVQLEIKTQIVPLPGWIAPTNSAIRLAAADKGEE